ncbi:MAG: HDOD domain-containing protein [Gammaproteobacteria bacterium]|nr:HDOD domain-containing protein [Gammaproteobacteria bacterium]
MATAVQLKDVVNNIDELVSLPAVFVRLNQLINTPHSTVTQLAEVIGQDPGLTVRLLRLANSAMFGMRARIDTISKAIAVIGIQRLRDLALASAAVTAFEKIPNSLLALEDFWMHSIRCGLAAKFLAEQAKLPHSDTLFIAGLLHDIGHLIMFKRIPQQSQQALQRCLDKSANANLFLIERELLGFDHSMVGAELARHWQLPEVLIETIRYHHQPTLATTFPRQAAIVHIANSVAVSTELNSPLVESDTAPDIDPAAWPLCQLGPEIIAPTAKAVRQHADNLRAALL